MVGLRWEHFEIYGSQRDEGRNQQTDAIILKEALFKLQGLYDNEDEGKGCYGVQNWLPLNFTYQIQSRL
jgi:hypothetical protein